MEKEFIPYKQALEIKELGFNQPCFGYYTGDKKHLQLRPNMGRMNEPSDDVPTAPTFSQAFRWFREEYGLFSNLDVIDNCATFYYEYQIVNHKDTEFYHDGHQARRLWNNLEFKTYEEAELECLKKLIELCMR